MPNADSPGPDAPGTRGRRRRWLRIVGGGALIVGGVLGFLPVLGFWMIPIGVSILGQEVRWVRRIEHGVMAKLNTLVRRNRRRDG